MKEELKRLGIVFGGFVLLISLVGIVAADNSAGKETASYAIKIEEKNPRLLKVRAELVLKDQILYMSRYGADQFPERWAKFVRNIKIVDKRARELKVTDLGDAKWKVDASPGLRVTLSYEVVLDHENHKWAGGIDGVAFAKEWGVFYVGRSYLVMNGAERENIGITFDVPADWRVSGSWNQISPNKFVADNLTDLSESMFFAGTHTEFSVERDGFELLFALGGEKIIAQQQDFSELANGVMDYYIDLIGGIPKSAPGKRFKKVLVIINSGSEVDGEVIGNHINMIFDPDGDAQSQMMSKFIFAHEFFHLWNGKSIRAADTTEDWFKEGVTSYYTLKALNHVGTINDDAYFAILNNLFYQRYSKDTGYGKLSMRDVASGFSKGEHWGLIYGGGLFIGLCQDIRIRSNNRNDKSLDDLMRHYYRKYAGTDKSYTTADLQNSMTEFAKADQAEFFKRYVFGVEAVPIRECLADAGLNATIESGQLKIIGNDKSTEVQRGVQKGVLGN